eukprot:gene19416-12067_t
MCSWSPPSSGPWRSPPITLTEESCAHVSIILCASLPGETREPALLTINPTGGHLQIAGRGCKLTTEWEPLAEWHWEPLGIDEDDAAFFADQWSRLAPQQRAALHIVVGAGQGIVQGGTSEGTVWTIG